MNFYQWLMDEKKLSKATASKYDLVIKNRISDWLPSYELPNNTIEFEALKRMIYTLDITKNGTGLVIICILPHLIIMEII
jgi:putative restriction endonuclease